MKATLALEDGTIFKGRSFTGKGEAGGEVIFNTGMTGYQEILTDPSYTGQMVTMTYPLIGNYGVNPNDVESHKIQAGGLIVKECCKKPSNWRSTIPLPEYLAEAGVMGIEGIDTRALTRHLRIHGAQRGYMATGNVSPAKLVEKAKSIEKMEGLNLADRVSCKKPYIWNGKHREFIDDLAHFEWKSNGPKLAVFDFGIKWNILRLMEAEGFDMLVLPSHVTADQVREIEPDAVFLSNGPGDPAAVTTAVDAARSLSMDFPMAGICLGHQILGLAMGGKTFKLKFGHHGCNHPVMDLETEKIEISSQNHGFCVDMKGLNFLEATHINLNDKTLEGFRHKEKPIMAIQHHPEAGPGPHDSRYFFGRFRKMVRETTGK